MTVDVAWVNYNPKAIARGYWDNELPERILRGQRHSIVHGFDLACADRWPWPLPSEGLVAVVPGQHNAAHVAELNRDLAMYQWVLLMVTGDEEGLFPWSEVSHPNIRTWAFAPNSPEAFQADRLLPFGPTPHGFTDLPKTLDWFFAGQVNTPERKQMAQALRGLDGGKLVESAGFAKGMAPEDYVTVMNRARVVPCPPAWKHPDSFRVWEALDAGAVPIVQENEYWQRVAPYAPWPHVFDWEHSDVHMEMGGAEYEILEAIHCKAWWMRQQYQYRRWLWEDIRELGGPDIAPSITVLIPTSPIEAHPSVAVINETLNSVSSRLDAPVIVMADGVRPEQEHYRQRYEQYLRELVRLPGVVPVLFDEFTHQANMTRRALDMVDSEFVLFVEHDTPLVGEIPWDRLLNGLEVFDVVRLLHETDVLPEHSYLHGERSGEFLATTQWSQRPHLARTEYYRRIIEENFTAESRTMIEDTMHSKAQIHPEEHRIGIYYPEGSKLRSTHLDGRGADPKYEMVP